MKTPIVILMALSLLLSGCTSMRENLRDARPDRVPLAVNTPPEVASKDPDVTLYYGDPTRLINNFREAESAALGNAPSKAELQRYMHLGFALSDVYCGVYMNQITHAYNYQRFARSTTSDVGGLAALGLGLLKNSAQIISLTAGSFAFADNIFRNYTTAYMPPDNIRKSFDVLSRARTQLLEQLSSKEVSNVAQVGARINFYASTCTMAWMERFVSSVAETATDAQIQKVLAPSNPTIEVQTSSNPAEQAQPPPNQAAQPQPPSNQARTSVESNLRNVPEPTKPKTP